MKKIFVLTIALFGLVVLAGAVFAHGVYNSGFNGQIGTFHEQMEEVMESGTFVDFESLREETGMFMMPWVVDEETFQQAQERHEQMEEFRESAGNTRGFGMMGSGFGPGMMQGFRGGGFGCPMHS